MAYHCANLYRMQPGATTYITVAKAAQLLDTTPAEVVALVEAGALPHHDDDGRLMVSRRVVTDKAGRR